MKYCDNCGAKLEDDTIFCPECGEKQQIESIEKKIPTKKKRKGLVVFIILIILLVVGICGGGYLYFVNRNVSEKKEVKQVEVEQEKPKTIKEQIEWSENDNKVSDLKEKSLTEYPDRKIGESIQEIDSATKWKVGEEAEKEYLYCIFKVEGQKQEIIFLFDEEQNILIAEYYIADSIQEEKVVEDFCNKVFIEKEEHVQEENAVSFIGKIDVTYQIQDPSYEAEITIKNLKDNIAEVNINISNDMYNLTYYGTIISESIIQFTMDGGEKINLMWKDENTFDSIPVNGFGDESISLMRLMCMSLNNMEYKTGESHKSVQAVQPPSGIYWEGDTPPNYANYYVEFFNFTSQGFDFVIYGRHSIEDDFSVVFNPHTAIYTDTYTGVYYGKEYTLTFNWQELGYLNVKGFEEWIPNGSPKLYNNSYLGVS